MRFAATLILALLYASPALSDFVVGAYGDNTAAGWSTYTPVATTTGTCALGTADGTCAAYVSNAGNDTTCVLTTVGDNSKPCATLQKCLNLLRDGKPDWCLAKRGDSWTESLQPRGSGQSSTKPWLLSNYDPADPTVFDPATSALARPIIFGDPAVGSPIDVVAGGGVTNSAGNNLAIIGLDLYAKVRDPNNAAYDPTKVDVNMAGVTWLNHSTWALIEDCRVRFFSQGIGMDASQVVLTLGMDSNFTIRRNVIQNNYSIHTNGGDGVHPGGVNNFVLEENVIDHNGYMDNPTFYFILLSNSNATATATYKVASIFTVSSASATQGATYTNNGQTFTVVKTIAGSTSLLLIGTGPPQASGTLTKATGTGDATITFSSNDWASDNLTVYTVNATLTSGTNLQVTYSGVLNNHNTGTLGKASGTGDAAIDFTDVTNTISGQYEFNHNIYISAYLLSEFDRNNLMFPTTIRGNIISQSSSDTQARSTVASENNLWVRNPIPHTIASPTIGQNTTFSKEVYLEGAGNKGLNVENGPANGNINTSTNLDTYQYEQGNQSLDSILMANTLGLSGGNGIALSSGNPVSVTNSTIFNWHTPLIDLSASGSASGYSVNTAGSGGSAMPSFTGFIDDGSGGGAPSGVAGNILTVTSITGTPLKIYQKLSSAGIGSTNVYIFSLGSGTGGTGSYGLFIDNITNGTESSGTLNIASQTISISRYFVEMTGASCSTDPWAYISVSAGAVNAIDFYPAQAAGAFGGAGCTQGGTVSPLSNADIGGVTGFIANVTSVNTQTQTNNQLDAAGSNNNPGGTAPKEPFPGCGASSPSPSKCTTGQYDSDILSGPGTFSDFISQISARSKTNWASNLTAQTFNDWARAGFSMSVNASGRGSRSWIGRF